MSNLPPLALDRIVQVNGRFARSVSVLRDSSRPESLAGYVLTPTGRDVLRRISCALSGETAVRAWSLTGPYGTGKSAFANFVVQLLAGDDNIRDRARRFLAAEDKDAYESLFAKGGRLARRAGRLCAVLVTGSRRSLARALVEGLREALKQAGTQARPRQLLKKLSGLAEQPSPPASDVARLYEEASEFIAERGPESGLLLVIDELGKFLEFHANSQEQGDVFVLQELAEVATRAKCPFLFLTILHQSLDRYAEHLSSAQRAEWAKVQGRFEDIAFEERTEQLLRLSAQAICHEGPEEELKALRKLAKGAAHDALSLGLRAGSMSEGDLRKSLSACYPLHPLAAMVLGPLFRQLAQNERSLFAFLSSSEPFGFREFLAQNSLRSGAYRLDQLYDYVITSLGPTLFAQHRGKVWAEVQSALDRLGDASELDVRIAKTIGVLQAIGPAAGIPASNETLRIALKGEALDLEIDASIKALLERSVVVFRRHSGSYALWEGSDVDIDDRMLTARRAVEAEHRLATFLDRHAPSQSMIARRHYFQKGTLRFFDLCYADVGSLSDCLARDFNDADGRIIYCLPRNLGDRAAMRKAAELATDRPVVVAIPRDLMDLQELCYEHASLQWLAHNTPELETDRTARREVQARLALTQQNLRSHLDRAFSPANGDRCAWFCRGKHVTLSSQRGLNDLLSNICDDVYKHTPTWRNELVNRRSLSSAAAAARRNLIEAMLERSADETLGIAGTPPERSMYETLLRGSRLHRKHGGRFAFHGPDSRAEPAVRELWKAIDAFLDDTKAAKQSVEAMFELLRRPPFGLKDGVLPILLATVLVHDHSQVALYEEGTFVPRPNTAVFERMCRSPGKFQLQRFRIAGPRAEVFQRYASMLNKLGADSGKPDLLSVVRPLVRVVRDLPEYTGKTRQISESAQRVLKTMRESRQPDRLLFDELPSACGSPAFEASGRIPDEQVESYFSTLRTAFAELQRAYPQLVVEIKQLIVTAFGCNGAISEAREEIEHYARLVLNLAVEPKLKSFLLRLTDKIIDEGTWAESIATLLAGKPPTAWDDQDRARFEVQLAATVRTFEHFKVLAYEMERSGFALLNGNVQMLRVSITVPNEGDLERVVQVPLPLLERAERAKREVLKVLRQEQLLEQNDVGVAVLGELARQLMANPNS